MSKSKPFYIGISGWNIPKHLGTRFSKEGSALKRYSQEFNCVEINSSFYRDHKWQTYENWANQVPEDFLFSVKLSQLLTHQKQLEVSRREIARCLDGPIALQEKLGVILIQLSPGHQFDVRRASQFFQKLRRLYFGSVALEPRHKSWVSKSATFIFRDYGISLVEADPKKFSSPKNSLFRESQIVYTRLHGSPEMYKSKYTLKSLMKYAQKWTNISEPCWFIFDNTIYGHAIENAFQIKKFLHFGN